MKKLVREFEFSDEQLHAVRGLARAVGVTETTASILYARGADTPEKADAFLHPSEAHFLSPFLMRGMREAVDLLTRARDEEWRVAVFGDYDADGIGACAILSRALRRFGIEPYLFVPERTDGYGLSVSAVDRIFDEFLPDLVVTVDCGISCHDEVEYIKEQGADVIVTDHHELPDLLPDCIVIDPKLEDDYPYDNLCGAGVAWKLAEALIGKEARDLIDFAALSTVADSVPLTGENRDIVAVGLGRIAHAPRPVFSALLGKTTEEVTAQTVSYTLAPRVNAAGRMGDAASALRLFTSEDEEEIAELAARLGGYNAERQKCCDELYTKARAEIAASGAFGNVVMLAGEDWNAGFVGIVAARVAEEFSRPALLFVRRGNMLKGSARSIENVNIFEALRSCSEHIAEFGGHAQAAGVNVSEGEFEALRLALDDYLGSRYSREDFIPVVYISGEWTEDFARVAHEISLLEPFGVGNRRPLFAMKAGKLDAAPLKPDSPHLSFRTGGFDFMYFNGAKELDILQSDLEKTVVFEYNLSRFRGREYIKGFVRCVPYDGMSGREVCLDALENGLRRLLLPARQGEVMGEEELKGFLASRIEKSAYGLCVLTGDRRLLARYPALEGLSVDVFRPTSSSGLNTALYAPAPDCALSAFREVVVLEGGANLPELGNARLIFAPTFADMGAMKELNCDREALLDVFRTLRRREGVETGPRYAACARLFKDLPPAQTVFSLAVFEELGLVTLREGRLRFIRGKKTELGNSRIYRAVLRAKEEG